MSDHIRLPSAKRREEVRRRDHGGRSRYAEKLEERSPGPSCQTPRLPRERGMPQGIAPRRRSAGSPDPARGVELRPSSHPHGSRKQLSSFAVLSAIHAGLAASAPGMIRRSSEIRSDADPRHDDTALSRRTWSPYGSTMHGLDLADVVWPAHKPRPAKEDLFYVEQAISNSHAGNSIRSGSVVFDS